MKVLKLSPPYLLLSAIAIAFTTMMNLQAILYLTGPAYPEESYGSFPEEQLVLPTTTITASAQRTTMIEPTSTTQPSENTLRLGYVKRGMNCSFITQIVMLVLKKELNSQEALGVNVVSISFDTDDELFTALAEKDVDVTLCVIDPNDRTHIKKRLGHIRQIGSYYWSDGHSKLQIWANGAAKAEWRKKNPCLLRFLENLHFKNLVFQGEGANMWLQNHADDQLQTWITCVPENLEE